MLSVLCACLAQVLADGEDVRELDARWYRSQLGVVSQVVF